MDEYGPETYGERVADVYDEWYRMPVDEAAECDFLADLAGSGPVLELGIGTGRAAIPLAARGIEVHGIDSSPAMLERLRAKPGGEAIRTSVGNMADVDLEGEFALVFITFNTFFMLTTQADQVRCIRNIAAHLAPRGRFVLHAFVPDTSRIERGQDLSVREVGLDRVRLDATIYDAVNQRLATTQVRIEASGLRFVHARLRYAPPPELDLMAQLGGLELESRWGSFARSPFTEDSAFAVSVYRRA
jgi:SAM-dependent methyltransferase